MDADGYYARHVIQTSSSELADILNLRAAWNAAHRQQSATVALVDLVQECDEKWKRKAITTSKKTPSQRVSKKRKLAYNPKEPKSSTDSLDVDGLLERIYTHVRRSSPPVILSQIDQRNVLVLFLHYVCSVSSLQILRLRQRPCPFV